MKPGIQTWHFLSLSLSLAPVILDPNTAAPFLSLSEELTSMKFCTDNPQLPENPERFSFGAEMLGSQGFFHGTHQWDVEVGDNFNWAVGVAFVGKEETSDERIFALRYMNGCYTTISGPVPVQNKLHRVRVVLDCDRRSVTFSDPVCSGSIPPINFECKWPLFPYFYSSCEEHPLRIAPNEVTVSVRAPKLEQEKSSFSFSWIS